MSEDAPSPGPAAAAAELEVLHRVPGRVRLALRPLDSRLLSLLVEEAGRLQGVRGALPGASGRNLVVRYSADAISLETLLTRLALVCSARLGYRPVRLIRQRRRERLDRVAVAAGAASGVATAMSLLGRGGLLAGAAGWTGALMTLTSVGRDVTTELLEGRPRPEGLSLIHLLSRMGGPGRGPGALLTWLLYYGKPLADHLRGARAVGLELRPVMLRSGVGEDLEGRHMEIVTRPLHGRGINEGKLLSPATLASALLGYLAYSLRQGGYGGGAAA
jgi:hypothetical protein